MIPYVTPAMLISAPLGVSWSGIPTGGNAQAQLAEQTNIAWRATQAVDDACNQPLRATLNTEQWRAPNLNARATLDRQGILDLVTSRWPVLAVISGQRAAAASFPSAWQPIPSAAMLLAPSVLGVYGSDITGAAGVGPRGVQVAPGYVDWSGGRGGWRVQIAYLNGWPHTAITLALGAAGASTAMVDDVTGWAGASGIIYDGANTETVTVIGVTPAMAPVVGSAPSGPGTVTFAAPGTTQTHTANCVLSAMPATVQRAAMLFAAAEAMTRGSTAVTVQAMPGSSTSSAGARGSAKTLTDMAKEALRPYGATWA